MSQHAVVTDCDRLAKNRVKYNRQNKTGPAEEQGYESQECQQVNDGDTDGIQPEEVSLNRRRPLESRPLRVIRMRAFL